MTTAPEDNIRDVIATPTNTAKRDVPTSSVPTVAPEMSGATTNPPVIPTESFGLESGVIAGVNYNPVGATATETTQTVVNPIKKKRKYTYTDEKTGDLIDVFEDDTEEVRTKGTKIADAELAAEATAAARLAERVSAYDILYSEFKDLGLESLVEEVKTSIINSQSKSERLLALRGSESYKKRFAANAQRVAKGLTALDEASYLEKEDAYQNLMRNYGLPDNYWVKDATGRQQSFETLIANDVSAVELEARMIAAQDRVLKANPEVLQALKTFYPDIKNGDILAYTLDPKNAIKDIQRKVTTAEIGGAAARSGLTTNVSDAEYLQRYGVTKETADQGYTTIAGGLQRGSQLASIYGEDPYTQATAEQEVFNVPGAQDARKQRQKVIGLEKATFGGQSGLTSGALARDRAGGY